MMKLVSSSGLFGALTAMGALTALTAGPLRADFGPAQYCGGSNFETCASVQLTVDGTGLNNNLVTIVVTNDGMAPSVFTNVGLIGLPAGRTVTVVTGSGGNGGNWASWGTPPPNDLSGDGLPNETFGMRAPNPGPSNGLMVGQTISFQFNIMGAALTQQEQDALGVGVHGQAGPGGCSTKLGVVNGQVIDNADHLPECTTVAPEPTTMILLGSGLAGVAAARRRRRQGQIEIDA